MTDRTGSMLDWINRADDSMHREIVAGDMQARVRTIIEAPILELMHRGMEREAACTLLASQYLMRMPSLEKRRELLHLIDPDKWPCPEAVYYGAAEDDDDDDDGEPA